MADHEDDPILAEIRAARNAILAEHGGSVRALGEALCRQDEEDAAAARRGDTRSAPSSGQDPRPHPEDHRSAG